MFAPSIGVFCRLCGRQLDEPTDLTAPRLPCPSCGSLLRATHLTATEELPGLADHVKYRARQKHADGRGGWAYEHTEGDDLHKATGAWNRIRRIIDRRLNRYEERIEAPDGRLIRNVRESLDKHQGHGSAKHKTPRPPST